MKTCTLTFIFVTSSTPYEQHIVSVTQSHARSLCDSGMLYFYVDCKKEVIYASSIRAVYPSEISYRQVAAHIFILSFYVPVCYCFLHCFNYCAHLLFQKDSCAVFFIFREKHTFLNEIKWPMSPYPFGCNFCIFGIAVHCAVSHFNWNNAQSVLSLL